MIDGIDPGWWWAIGGVALLIAELLAPGIFLVFIGAAAIATGVFALLFGLGLPAQLVLFAIYSALAVMAGRRFYQRKDTPGSALVNDRSAQLVGRSVTVLEAVDSHGGRVRLGDSDWSARGGPAAVGERVLIRSIDGNCLIVDSQPGVLRDQR